MGQWDTACPGRQPGCYLSPEHDALRVTLAVPEGWAGILGSIWLDEIGNAAPNGAGLLLGRGAWLLSDPCPKTEHELSPDVPVGPSVEDFANALADHPLLDVTDPIDVTLAGYSGKYLDLQVPADISKCEVYLPFDPGIYAQGPSHRWHLWILDVAGLRFVVQSTDYAGTSEKHRSELQAIVDSINDRTLTRRPGSSAPTSRPVRPGHFSSSPAYHASRSALPARALGSVRWRHRNAGPLRIGNGHDERARRATS